MWTHNKKFERCCGESVPPVHRPCGRGLQTLPIRIDWARPPDGRNSRAAAMRQNLHIGRSAESKRMAPSQAKKEGHPPFFSTSETVPESQRTARAGRI